MESNNSPFRPGQPNPGIIEYIAYAHEMNPARRPAHIGGQGFGPTGTSLLPPALEYWHHRLEVYALPWRTGVGSSVCRVVDGEWAVVGIRTYAGPEWRLDACGYLLFGHPETLTGRLALR